MIKTPRFTKMNRRAKVFRKFGSFPNLNNPFKPYKFPLPSTTLPKALAQTPDIPFIKQPWRREGKKPLLLEIVNPIQDPVITQLPNPREIKIHLDDYIIGQDELKIALSVAIYNHYQRIEINSLNEDTRIDKSNILLFGSTGSGEGFV
jgi:hypothetical protein